LGQMREIFFMLLIPFFFRRLGGKWMILVGMAAWVGRYLLFSYGASEQATWMILFAVLLHGVCYDFFFVTGFMYTNEKAPVEVRGQAQSMLVFFTQGLGMYFGYQVAFGKNGTTVTKYQQLSEAIAAKTPEVELSFGESLGRMFSVSLPEGLDQQLLGETMEQWREFWMLPAIMAGVIMIVFALLFYDKIGASDSEEQAGPDAS